MNTGVFPFHEESSAGTRYPTSGESMTCCCANVLVLSLMPLISDVSVFVFVRTVPSCWSVPRLPVFRNPLPIGCTDSICWLCPSLAMSWVLGGQSLALVLIGALNETSARQRRAASVARSFVAHRY